MHGAGDLSREEARWAQLQAARAGAPPAQLAGAYQRAVDTHRSQAQVRACLRSKLSLSSLRVHASLVTRWLMCMQSESVTARMPLLPRERCPQGQHGCSARSSVQALLRQQQAPSDGGPAVPEAANPWEGDSSAQLGSLQSRASAESVFATPQRQIAPAFGSQPPAGAV